MEMNGLVHRKIYHETPIRIEYYLTEKGKALKSVLDQMAGFSVRYCPKDVFKDGEPRILQQAGKSTYWYEDVYYNTKIRPGKDSIQFKVTDEL
jgi:HxlR-like helix-turn-helix